MKKNKQLADEWLLRSNLYGLIVLILLFMTFGGYSIVLEYAFKDTKLFALYELLSIIIMFILFLLIGFAALFFKVKD